MQVEAKSTRNACRYPLSLLFEVAPAEISKYRLTATAAVMYPEAVIKMLVNGYR